MKHFPERWQAVAQAARRVPGEPIPPMPPGFTHRILACRDASAKESLLDLLSFLGLRITLASAVLFILSTALAATQVDVLEMVPAWIETPLTARLLLP